MPVASEQSTTQPRTSRIESVAAAPQRNIAVDAYRGLVMLLMMAEVLEFWRIARAYPASTFWHILACNQTHVEWAGMSLHDTIQPGFTFLAGVSLPYSIRSRQRKGESFRRMLLHTIWRSVLLVALGIFLRSNGRPITYFTFEDTLTPDRARLHLWIPAHVCSAALAVDRIRRSSFRLLAGVGALSRARAGIQLRGGGRGAGLASAPLHRIRCRTGTRTAISARRSTSGS